MSFLVDVVFLGRRMTPDATSLQVIYLFTTGPEIATRISVLDWGNGQSEEVTPQTPSTAFTYETSYLGGFDEPSAPLYGTATFAAQVQGRPGYHALVNLGLVLDPDATGAVEVIADSARNRMLMVTGSGDDSLTGGLEQDTIHGGMGNDVLDGGRGSDALYGEGGDDVLSGGIGNDFMSGNAGADSLSGGTGHDGLLGGVGDDTLDGGGGNDDLQGGAGDDMLRGGGGGDFLGGDGGNDSLRGDAGDDTLLAGDGEDTAHGGAGADSLYGGEGADTLLGAAGNDTLDGGNDNDRLAGGAGNDLLIGVDGNDLLLGGDGDDYLMGVIGRDTLVGGAGADTFFGSVGADVLITQADGVQDTFMFINPETERDVIRGFVSGEDVVRLFFGTPGPVIQGADPVAEAGQAAALFDTDNSRLFYDLDGAGGASAVLIATLVGITSLQDGDVIFG